MKTTRLFLSALLLAALHATAAPGIDWNNGVSYTYDPAGNLRAMGTDVHVYDVAGRLVQSDTNGIRQNYEYDGFGNRTKCLSPGTDCQHGYGIDAQTNRLSGVPYDAAGHLQTFEGHTYDYDDLDMQSRDHTTLADREYIYTADDERIAVYSVGAGQWKWTLRDASGKVLREMTSQNGSGGTLGTASWTWVKDHVWRDGQLLASRQIEPGSSTPSTYHYHLDHLGTPRRITNDGDQIAGVHNYHAFGRETAGGTNERSLTVLEFTGHERDLVGSEGCDTLDYMHARYYSACVGRFLSVDPALDFKQALKSPQGWNRYSYVLNNPLVFTDPTGTSVYVVAYTTGNRDGGDDEFRRAAETRAREIQKRKNFDPQRDTVLEVGVASKGDFKAALKLANALSSTYGQISQIDLYSHAGPMNGPRFNEPDGTFSQFMTQGELSQLSINWSKGAEANFFGCNTATNFTREFASAQGVWSFGQPRYAYFSSNPGRRAPLTATGPVYLISAPGGHNPGPFGIDWLKFAFGSAKADKMIGDVP